VVENLVLQRSCVNYIWTQKNYFPSFKYDFYHIVVLRKIYIFAHKRIKHSLIP